MRASQGPSRSIPNKPQSKWMHVPRTAKELHYDAHTEHPNLIPRPVSGALADGKYHYNACNVSNGLALYLPPLQSKQLQTIRNRNGCTTPFLPSPQDESILMLPIAGPLHIRSSTLSHLVIVESARPQSYRMSAVVDIPKLKSVDGFRT